MSGPGNLAMSPCSRHCEPRVSSPLRDEPNRSTLKPPGATLPIASCCPRYASTASGTRKVWLIEAGGAGLHLFTGESPFDAGELVASAGKIQVIKNCLA